MAAQNRSGKKPDPKLVALMAIPFAVIVMAYGWWIGSTRELTSRGGFVIELAWPWNWVVGGGFMTLGAMILAMPIFYHLRDRRQRRSAK